MSQDDPIDSLSKLQSLKERELRERVIIPLLQKMGYQGVYHNHGTYEIGKDIVAYMVMPGSITVNYAVVAKAGNITNKQTSKVAEQVREALNSQFRANTDSLVRRADIALVITNGSIPQLSKDKIEAIVGISENSRIRWWDDVALWNNWQTHFPIGIALLKEQIQSELTKSQKDPAIMAREWVEEDRRGTDIVVRDPSRLNSRHTHGSLRFEGPQTTEGRREREKFIDFYKTGAPTTLSGSFFKLTLPEAVESILIDLGQEIPNDTETITLSSVPSVDRFAVRLEILCDDGDTASLDYIDWQILQAGTERTTFANNDQQIPVRFTLSFDSLRSSAAFTIGITDDPVSATWIKQWMDLQRCLTKTGRMRIIGIKSELVVFEGPHAWDQELAFTDADYQFFSDLAELEQIVQRPIYYSDDLSDDEQELLDFLLQALRSTVVESHWSDARLGYSLQPDDQLMEDLLSGKERPVSFTKAETVTVGSALIDLGPVKYEIASLRLVDTASTQELVKLAIAEGESEVVLEIEAGADPSIRRTFELFTGHSS